MNTIHDENKIKELVSKYCLDVPRFIPDGMFVSAQNAMKEYAEYIRSKTIDECIALIPEIKDIGYETEQEKPNLQDEILADFYQTKAEAFFAGCDKTVEKTITNLSNLKNNG